jgi:hypothetical protein
LPSATASVLETVLLYNMRDKITNQFRGYVRKLAFGQPNHALDTYVYNLAALEIAAEAFCRETLELPALDRDAFRAEIKRAGEFYETPPSAGGHESR